MSIARNMRRAGRKRTGKPHSKAPSPKAIIELYEEHGCTRCGGKGVTSIAGVMPDGQIICRACLDPSEHRQAVSWLCGIAAQSDGAANDREWFAKNPGKEWRLRPLFHMEFDELVAQQMYINLSHGLDMPPPEVMEAAVMSTAVFTLQIKPGKRARILCAPPEDEQTRAAWAGSVMLPLAKAQAARVLAVSERMTPEFRMLAANAAALVVMPRGPEFIATARAQGEAMRELKKTVTQ